VTLLLPSAAPTRSAPAPAVAPPFEADSAVRAVRSAAPSLGVPSAARGVLAAGEVSVVRVVSTAVLRAGSVALKVYAPGVDLARLEAAHAAVAAAPESWVVPLGPPVPTPYGTVVAYPWVESGEQPGWGEIGALVRRWHEAGPGAVALPAWTPLSRVPTQVAAYAARPDADAGLVRLLLTVREQLVLAAGALRSDLGWGVIHGDVSADNVLRRAGAPVFVDLDWVAVGPREYDLVPCAQRRERGEVDEATYEEFAAAYGHDVRGWSGLGLIEEICAFGGTTFALWLACQRGEGVGWLRDALARYA
jgi:hypothetical protein